MAAATSRDIVLVRHAACVDAGGWIGEIDRYLTAEGRDRGRALGLALRSAGVAPAIVLTSPLVRAVQTAELILAGLEFEAMVVVSPALLPGASPEELVDELGRRDGAVVAVGHAPDMRARAAALLSMPRTQIPGFSRGMAMVIESSIDLVSEGQFRWAWRPRGGDVVETLADLR